MLTSIDAFDLTSALNGIVSTSALELDIRVVLVGVNVGAAGLPDYYEAVIHERNDAGEFLSTDTVIVSPTYLDGSVGDPSISQQADLIFGAVADHLADRARAELPSTVAARD